jgi:hypothetical protein
MEVALIGKTKRKRHLGNRHPQSQSTSGLFEADLHMVRMEGKSEFVLELPRQLETACRRHRSQLGNADCARMIVQIVPDVPQTFSVCSGLRHAGLISVVRCEADEASVKQLVGCQGPGRRRHGPPRGIQQPGKCWVDQQGSPNIEPGNRALESIFDNTLKARDGYIKHSVCVSARRSRSTIVYFTRIDRDDITRCAVVRLTSAPESLNTALGDTNRVGIVHVSIEHMPVERRLEELDAVWAARAAHPFVPGMETSTRRVHMFKQLSVISRQFSVRDLTELTEH